MGVASHAGHAAGPYDGMYLGSARQGSGYLHHGLRLHSTLELDLVWHHLQVRHVRGKGGSQTHKAY